MEKINKKHWLIIIVIAFVSAYFYNSYFTYIPSNKNVDKKSKFYINDLYQSDGKFYKLLSGGEQKFYDDIIKAYKKFNHKVKLDVSNYRCRSVRSCDVNFMKALNYIMLDHPELLQLAGYGYSSSNRDSRELNVVLSSALIYKQQYHLGIRKIRVIMEKIKKDTDKMIDKEKVRYVYEWIGTNTKYDKLFTAASKNQSAYSALVSGSGVCAAYAKSAQILFQYLGIESYMVHGTTDAGYHLWNIVKVDDNYYFFDATVASSISKNSDWYYKGLTQSFMSGYSMTEKDLYPKTSAEEYLLN